MGVLLCQKNFRMTLTKNSTVIFWYIVGDKILKRIKLCDRIHGDLTKFMMICHQIPRTRDGRQIAVNMRGNNGMYSESGLQINAGDARKCFRNKDMIRKGAGILGTRK